MNLADIVAIVGQKIGKTDSATLTVAKKFCAQRYLMIYDSAAWVDSQYMTTQNCTTSGIVILPSIVDRVIAVRSGGSSNLDQIELGTIFLAQPTLFENTGVVVAYTELPPIGCSVLPAAAGKLSLSSNSSSDTNFSVRIHGDLSQVQARESVLMAGQATVMTINSYDTPYMISKTNTAVGTITVKDSNSNTILTLLPDDYEQKFPRIQILGAPTATTAMLVLFKRKPEQLLDDNDVPRIRNIENALIAYTLSDMLEWLRQYAKAAQKLEEAKALLAEARDMENNQAQHNRQIVPVASGEWTVDDFNGGFGSYTKTTF